MNELNVIDLLISFSSLAILLIILDIDNVIFMSILSSGLNEKDQHKAQRLGLLIGVVLRGVLIMVAGYLVQMKDPIITILNEALTAKDLLTTAGGIFLVYKSTTEIHNKLEGEDIENGNSAKNAFYTVLVNIAVINLVFSVDSVITAVGMVNNIGVMLAAMSTSMVLMYIFQRPIAEFITKHPTMKILALSFLLLIGVFLVVEGVHLEVPKGYIYFAMAFSFGVELLNIRWRRTKENAVQLRGPHMKK